MADQLTPRQREIAGYVVRGWSTKRISKETGLSPETVKDHIEQAAARIPGSGAPRYKILFFILTTEEP